MRWGSDRVGHEVVAMVLSSLWRSVQRPCWQQGRVCCVKSVGLSHAHLLWLHTVAAIVAESLHRSCPNNETLSQSPPSFLRFSNSLATTTVWTPRSTSRLPFVIPHLLLHAVEPIHQIPDTCLNVQASGRASISSSEPPPSSNELETETRRLCKLLCIRPNVLIAAYLIPSLSTTSRGQV